MTFKTLVSCVEKRSTIPVLSQIRVNGNRATATDLDIDIEQDVDLPDGCYYHQGFAKGIYVRSRIPLSDFPSGTKTGGRIAEITLDAAQIAALKWILLAASTEETRYYLNGVCFSQRGHIIATDGHRIHCIDFNPAWLGKEKQDFIVPRKAVKMMLDLCKELSCEEIRLRLCERGFTAEIGNARITGKLIDGTYPDYSNEKVMPPTEGAKHTTFNQASLLQFMPELWVLSEIESSRNHPGINIIDGKAIFRSTGEIGEEKKYDIDFKLPFPVAFNAKYLEQLCGGDVYFSDNVAPFRFIDDSYTPRRQAVLMPMRYDPPVAVIPIKKGRKRN